jgi:fumarylacetoacetate (FAA) hydrolase
MKLASLPSSTRDGCLVVVSRDLRRMRHQNIAATLQQAIDAWAEVEPQLQTVYADLNGSPVAADPPFELSQVLAPLPRAYHWVDGSAYVAHIELVRRARGADMPPSFWTEPIIYQGGSDDLLGPFVDVPFLSVDHGIDCEAELGVIVTDVEMGTDAETARSHIKLLTLINDWSLRNLIPAELAKGFGFYQSKPATGFAGVVVTPDELDRNWDGARAHGPVTVYRDAELIGDPIAGTDMTFDFPTLIAYAARTRRLAAGTIVGAGTICNRDESRGSACIAERRAREMIRDGAAHTPYFKFGERVRIEMRDAQGNSIFGAIDQRVTQARRTGAP